ncbi:serpin family protein [Streptomyces sp. NRRL B-24484]|uniref:serpin family protein n=1 Tax=Streptomyces sp. NRRL B-24484 TaxID=1463833 RepID=UPI0004C0758A|nr:serpin family protein [Streptomyces sp. NRRL B-24484]
METAADTARIVNALAERWAHGLGGTGRSTVFTAVGVWPLLGFLAAGADGAARKELEEALGLPAEEAARRGRELLALLRDVPGAGAAVGLWTAGGIRPEPAWLAEVGGHTRGTLKGVPAIDRLVLDRWARKHTGGLVRSMPLDVGPGLLLVLASAVAVRTRWRHAFGETWRHSGSGPWAGRAIAALGLDSTELFDHLAVAETAAGPVTEVRLPGTAETDVHLLLGAEDAPLGEVLAAGVALLDGRARRIPAAGLPTGGQWPGLTIDTWDSTTPGNRLDLTTAAFTVDTTHDLLERAETFGLAAARDQDSFPGICRTPPLRVTQAKQRATAVFGARGFEAAAVTAVGMSRGMPAPPSVLHRVTVARACVDRPFAFLAVHRPTGLVLAGGWITEPADTHPSV